MSSMAILHRRCLFWCNALALVCVLVMSGCGDGDTPTTPTPPGTPGPTPPPPPPPTASTLFRGTFASAGTSGSIELTLQAEVRSEVRSIAPSSGSLQLVGGGTVNLSGTYDESTRQLAMAGGGFSLEGRVADGGDELVGTLSDPSGSGGTFTALNATGNAISNYCGTATGEGEGVWNMTLGDGVLTGTWASTVGFGSGTLSGSVAGNNVRGQASRTGDPGYRADFQGTISGQELSGQWEDSTGSSGDFSGSTPCQR